MMGGWMEVGAQLGIGAKLTAGSPSGACYEGWDAQQSYGDGEPRGFAMPIPGLTYLV